MAGKSQSEFEGNTDDSDSRFRTPESGYGGQEDRVRSHLEPARVTASRPRSERFQHTYSHLAWGPGITEVGEELG